MTADMRGRIAPHFFGDLGVEKMRALSPRELEGMGRIIDPVCKGRKTRTTG